VLSNKGSISCVHILAEHPGKYRILGFQYMFLACDFDENLSCNMIFILETDKNTQQRRHPRHWIVSNMEKNIV
jgi:hypothetical protein